MQLSAELKQPHQDIFKQNGLTPAPFSSSERTLAGLLFLK
jgi:hypothetical protein